MVPRTIKEIEIQFAEVINRHAETQVEVTNRGVDLYTVSGSRIDVSKAVDFLIRNKIMVEVDREYDQELDECFSYMELAQGLKVRS